MPIYRTAPPVKRPAPAGPTPPPPVRYAGSMRNAPPQRPPQEVPFTQERLSTREVLSTEDETPAETGSSRRK